MMQFSVNTSRIDPYKNFKFRVAWDGQVVAGVSKVSALKRTTEVVSHREGGDVSTPRHSPASSKFDPITLERGITFAPEFEAWANLVYSTEGDGAVSLAGLRKNISIEMLNLQGTVVKRYNVFRCWVSEYTALPELDANANAIAFETIILQNEGFERDEAIAEVAET
ncbi:phage tail protein [Leptolyngbya cf. ectocarpi LEGE 11479]|uniref:Phage tail protein n=2 Tax=Leptolyngbya ectocarpi TaxID=1202 RepID=A0A928ZSM0_LEPEC|nr:phage tail protein [Leptolyngbya cf. ectocarpi LEGE 11479]